MKKLYILVFALGLSLSSFAWWTNLYNTGTPWKTYYLGDYQSDVFEFGVNEETSPMTVSYGIGTTTDGSSWTWRAAEWSRMDGTSNRVWKSKANEHQFTSTGTWYYSGRFVWTANGYTEYASTGWAENRVSLVATNYFTVNALSYPASTSATQINASQIDLSWTLWNSKNVMIVRKQSSESWTEPTQGTAYSVGNSIGSGIVVYNGSGTSSNNTGLTSSTAYDYKFYSVNNNYYSPGVVASATTTSEASDYFRSKANGNCSPSGTWESSDNNSAWVNATLTPTSSAGNVVIDHVVTIDADETAGSLTINTSKSLTINSGKSLTVTGTLTNSAGTSGLIIQSGAILLHNTNSVAATVERQIASDNGYHLISVPFSGSMPAICDGNFAPATANFNEIIGETYDFFKWNEGVGISGEVWTNLKNADWSVNTSDFGDPPAFENGKGYAVRYFTGFSGSAIKSSMGNLSNGSQSIALAVANNKLNLVGNPFPSPIDWKAASGWGRTNLAVDGSFGNSIWIYNSISGNYGVYSTATVSDAGTLGVTRYIAPNQGFFVKAATAGSMTLDNSVRVTNPASFLKNTNNSIRMQVSTPENTYSDEVLIEFGHPDNNGGSAKWWSMYAAAPSLYTEKDGKKYSINLLTNATSNPEIFLSFKAGVNGTHSLLATFDASIYESVKLIDMLTGNSQELTQNPVFQFTASTTDAPNRFKLTFGSVGIDQPATTGNHDVYVYGRQLFVQNPGAGVLEIFNFAGQLVVKEKLTNNGVWSQPLNLTTGQYVVRVVNGTTVRTTKVIL